MEIFIFWVIFTFVVATLGSSRTVGFWGAFFISLFLSPLIGIIVVFASRHKSEATPSSPPEENQRSRASYLEELEELGKLKEKGVITEEEFTKRKNSILN